MTIQAMFREIYAPLVGLASSGPLDGIIGFFRGVKPPLAKKFPCPIIDPVIGLLGYDFSIFFGAVCFIGAAIAFFMSDMSQPRRKGIKIVSAFALSTSSIVFTIGEKMANPAGDDIPIPRDVEILAGSLMYGAGVWAVGMLVVVLLFKKSEAN
ncbi:MAG: hypothetical protein WC551_00735 [Patescibacteria group bacterium]